MEKICKQKIIGNKKYFCYFELALQVIGGKWKVNILFHLGNKSVMRFGELKKAIPQISEKMLIQRLRELEADGMIHRKVFKQVPPKVEYSLTDLGLSLVPVLLDLRKWGVKYENETGLYKYFKDDDRYEQPNDFPKMVCKPMADRK
ncbi:MAG: helix-turn-helix domain-containing protein [Desulfobacteraceae bacterium]|jgi:DNA-binding HxlR family transcriptional regulator